MSITSKFYCKNCKQIKSRWQIKYVDAYYEQYHECKYCHNPVETVEHMLIRLDYNLYERKMNNEKHNLKQWIKEESIRLYPDNKSCREAFKTGIYTLLDKVGFNYD